MVFQRVFHTENDKYVFIKTNVDEFSRNLETITSFLSKYDQYTSFRMYIDELPDWVYIEFIRFTQDIYRYMIQCSRYTEFSARGSLLYNKWDTKDWIEDIFRICKLLEAHDGLATWPDPFCLRSENIILETRVKDKDEDEDDDSEMVWNGGGSLLPNGITFDDIQHATWMEEFERKYAETTAFSIIPKHIREYIYSTTYKK